MMDLEFFQLSDRGLVRENNEDHLGYVLPESEAQARSHGWLFALADGVGGQLQGEVASKSAIETLIAGFRHATAGEAPAALLERLIQAANHHVHEAGLEAGAAGAGMATTIVACALRYDRVAVAHVGDSRCYLIRHGHVSPLTRDHTFAREQARLGLQSDADSPTRHMLSRSLGSELFVSVDTSNHQVFAGDVLVLSSDGLHGSVTSADIAAALGQEADLEAAARCLVEIANQRDGSDNISVQLIRVRSVEQVGMYRGRPYRLR